jgi:hypothetical protein
MIARVWAVFATGILFACSLHAQQVCDGALIKSTYSSFTSDQTDWRLATLVSEKDYNEIKQDAGGNALIYGIPVGVNYSDFQRNIHDKLQTHTESLSRNQIRNILWTGLDPNSPGAYHDCLEAQVFASRGLHIAVKVATSTDITLLVKWNPQGSDSANIPLTWNWQGTSASQLPKTVQQGETTVVVTRPKQERSLAANYMGFSDSVILEPLAKLPPLPPLAPTWHTEDKDGRPYMSPDWVFPANCNGKYGLLRVDGTHRCEIDRTQKKVGDDNTPFDTWSLWIDAPQGALVTEVSCIPLGQNIVQVQGIPQGQTGLCTGLINGGTGPIRMTIKWKQLW